MERSFADLMGSFILPRIKVMGNKPCADSIAKYLLDNNPEGTLIDIYYTAHTPKRIAVVSVPGDTTLYRTLVNPKPVYPKGNGKGLQRIRLRRM